MTTLKMLSALEALSLTSMIVIITAGMIILKDSWKMEATQVMFGTMALRHGATLRGATRTSLAI